MEEDELLNSLLENELDTVKEGTLKPPVEMDVDLNREEPENTEESDLNVSNLESNPSRDEKDSENVTDKKPLDKSSGKKEETVRYRPLHLPLARIKQIIKMDPDVHMAGSEAVFLIAKATVSLFIKKKKLQFYSVLNYSDVMFL